MSKELFKTVGFNYPTSTNAKKFGYNETGCWTVALMDEHYKTKYLSAHPDKETAITEAEKLPNDWHWLDLKYNNVTNKTTTTHGTT